MAEPYIGEIRMFAGNFAPVDWAFCNGQLLAISDYDALYNLIGTTYGGDGVTTFALPNLQSRIPMHMGTGAGSTYVIGQASGTETVTLITSQIPAHTHIPQASTAGNAPAPASNVWAQPGNTTLTQYAPPPTTGTMAANALGSAGGSQPHDNLMPYTTISFIIALYGIYPSQS
ncbi:MAG: tail fiber protein [Chthoniobacteraceae bacterium]